MIRRSPSRAVRRDRAVARVKVPVPPTLRSFDPLVRPTGSKVAQLVRTLVLLVAAVGLHGFMLTAIFAANRAASSLEPGRPENQRIQVKVVEPPPPPPPVEPPPPPEPTQDPAEAEPPPPPPPKKKKEAPPPPPPTKAEPPPADPIDQPKDPPPKPDKPQPRRIAGLNLESTVSGGSGPSFAIGNTRMAKTERVAEDAKEVRKLDKTGAPPPRDNRKATRIPGTGKGKVSAPAPQGSRVQPDFPPLLRAQGVEGNVTVEVRIDEKGRVVDARVVEASRFKEFQQAALAAARKQRWKPASQGGKPIPYTLTYTYRFRITD